jgi:hypothetical protein
MTIRSIINASLAAIAAVAVGQTSFAQTSDPANKTSAVIMRNDIVFADPATDVLLAEEFVKTSKPTDLLLSVTAESSIITNVMTTGSETQRAEGQIEVYIRIDGQMYVQPAPAPVGVGNPPHGDTAEVVFANQIYSRRTQFNDPMDNSDQIETYLQTKHAAGFNWMAFNVGSGTHHIEVFARYTETQTGAVDAPGGTFAQGIIGNRSLVVQPVKSAVRETVAIN